MRTIAVLTIALLLPIGAVHGEVVDSNASGFTISRAFDIAAPPARVWEGLAHIGAWRDSRHTYSGDAKNLSIELKPGGCWCEALPGGAASAT